MTEAPAISERRWSRDATANVDAPNVRAFLAEIIGVCRRHGYSIAHEDTHGGFEIVPFSTATAEWLAEASLADGAKP